MSTEPKQQDMSNVRNKLFAFPTIATSAGILFAVPLIALGKITEALVSLASGLILGLALQYYYQYQFLELKYKEFEDRQAQILSEFKRDIDYILGNINTELNRIQDVLKKRPTIKRTNRHRMYLTAKKLVESSQEMLLVIQRSPTLFFEPKPPGLKVEREFKEALEKAIEKAKEGRIHKFIYAFSIYDPYFIEELKMLSSEKAEKVINSIIKALQETENTEGYGGKLYIISLRPENTPHPLIISDDSIALWITDIEDNKLYINILDQKGARDIFEYYEKLAEDFTAKKAILKLREIIEEIKRN